MGRYDAKVNQGTRVLTDDELRAIWKATEGRQPFHALVRFLLLTGARRNEATGLSWGEKLDGDWTLPACAQQNQGRTYPTASQGGAARAADRSADQWQRFDFFTMMAPPRVRSQTGARLKQATGTTTGACTTYGGRAERFGPGRG